MLSDTISGSVAEGLCGSRHNAELACLLRAHSHPQAATLLSGTGVNG